MPKYLWLGPAGFSEEDREPPTLDELQQLVGTESDRAFVEIARNHFPDRRIHFACDEDGQMKRQPLAGHIRDHPLVGSIFFFSLSIVADDLIPEGLTDNQIALIKEHVICP